MLDEARGRSRPVCACFREHLSQNHSNDFRPMLASSTLLRIGPLEGIRAQNLHLPSVVRLRSDNRNPPIPEPIGKRMFDDRSNLLPAEQNLPCAAFPLKLPYCPKISLCSQLSQTPCHYARILSAEPPNPEYDRGLWPCRSLSRANAEIPIGGVLFRPVP